MLQEIRNVDSLEVVDDTQGYEDLEPHISVNALTGNLCFSTMRVIRMVHNHPVHILIDSGSTFLDLKLAKELVCDLEHIKPQSIIIADGSHIPCQMKCKSFKWIMNVFAYPNGLPLSRGAFDDRMPLNKEAGPVNIRPYRYPLKQRDIIEMLVQEMMDRGIIQNSCSPFASPVVLVGKKDGTWRLCVDYNELNKNIVKDKFPILVFEELIDELAGATVFTKLDLRAGYHQLRVHPKYVYKTTFKTHTGHYEFLVMTFSLTNATASFQMWMNQVFRPLLRKCVLIFFYDILIHNASLVFELMMQN